MTLLTPWPAIIAGAIAGPILVAFYLLKLRRRPVRVSSTMLWDQAVQDLQANVPLRWIKPSLLLLLHLLILACLLLALARPVADLASSSADRIILIVDRSASMSAMDATGAERRTRLDEALDRAESYVRSLRSAGFDGQISLIASARDARVLAGPTGDPDRVLAALGSIEPTDQPGDLAAALRLAQALATQEREEDAPSQRTLTIVYSDGGDAGQGTFAVAGSDVRFERASIASEPSDTEQGSSATAPGADNLGIVALAARRDYDRPERIRIFARVQNALGREVSVTVSRLVAGQPVERSAITLAPARTPPAGSTTEPSQSPVTFEMVDPDAAMVELAIDRPDLLMSDNRAWVSVPPASRPAVLLVRPERSREPDAERTAWILGDVLEELDLCELRRVEASSYRADPARALRGMDLVIFDRVVPDRPPPIPSLSFGAGLGVPGLDVSEPPDDADSGTVILSWDRSAPLLRDVSLDGVFIGRTGVIEEDGSARILARGTQGPLIALGETDGVPHAVVAFDLAQSNWRLTVGFAIFLAQAVDVLGQRETPIPERPVTTSDPVEIRPDSDADRIVVERLDPSGERGTVVRSIPRDRWPEARAVGIGTLERAGLYSVRGGSPDRLGVSLLHARESAIVVRDSLDIAGQSVEGRADGSRRPVELWHWFVLAAGVLLAIEWALYAVRMRV